MRAALAPEALGRRTVREGNLAQYPAPIGHISFPCPACATQLAGSLARRTALASVIQFIGSGARQFSVPETVMHLLLELRFHRVFN